MLILTQSNLLEMMPFINLLRYEYWILFDIQYSLNIADFFIRSKKLKDKIMDTECF